jgi:hypothetical protein
LNESFESAHDIRRLRIPTAVIVEVDEQDARVLSTFAYPLLVQFAKVFGIKRQQNKAVRGGVREMF